MATSLKSQRVKVKLRSVTKYVPKTSQKYTHNTYTSFINKREIISENSFVLKHKSANRVHKSPAVHVAIYTPKFTPGQSQIKFT